MILYLIVAIAVAAGLFILLQVNPVTLGKRLFTVVEEKPQNIRDTILAANGVKKPHAFSKAFEQMKEVLAWTGRTEQYRRYCGMALACSVIGVLVAVVLDNLLLIPVLAAFGLLIPPLYVLVTAAPYSKRVNSQAGTAMSIVTSSYLRTENLPQAVKENLPIMRGPIKKVFTRFWTQTEYVNADTEKALQDMSREFSGSIFREWCKVLQLCQHDRSQIGMLEPLLKKQHNTEITQIEIDSRAPAQLKDCRTMVLWVLGAYGLLAVYNINCLLYMFTSIPGQLVTTGTIAVLFLMFYRVVNVLKPIRR